MRAELRQVNTSFAVKPSHAPAERRYLNWKEYLYQLLDQKLMEAAVRQLSDIEMSVGTVGCDNDTLLFKDF